MREKLTAEYVNGLRPQDKAFEVRDTDLTGLICRVQPSGLRVFFLQYRNLEGKTARLKLGRFPALNVARARKMAGAELARIVLGADPAAEKRATAEPEGEAETPAVLTLRGYIDRVYAPWCRKHKKSHATILNRLASGFVPLLDLPLADLTPALFREHRTARLSAPLGDRKKVPTPATVNRDFATLRPVLAMAEVDGAITTNPLAKVAKIKEDMNRGIRAMTPAEEKAIMAVFASRRKSRLAEVEKINARRKDDGRRPIPAVPRFLDYLEPMFTLSLETGIRRGEAFTLEWSDTDLDGRALTIRGEVAKSYQSRTIPLTARAHDTLSEWRKQGTGEGLVFPSRIGGGPLGNIDGAWRALCEAAKVTGLRWHDLRHTFGSRAARAGVNIQTLKMLMGHSSIVTTQRYLHSTDDDARAAIDLLEGKK